MPATNTSMGIRERLRALAQVLSQEVEAPTSLHSQAQQQPLDANFIPRASQRRAIRAAPALRPLLSGLPGVHHAEAARAGARNGGQGRGGGGAAGSSAHSRLPAGRAIRPLAQAHGTARVPALPPTRTRTQRAGGKARSTVSIYGAASGPERPGLDSRGRSWARRNRKLGRELGRGAARLPLPSPSLNGLNGLVGRVGPDGCARAQAPRWRPPPEG